MEHLQRFFVCCADIIHPANIMQPGIWRFLRFWASPFANSSSSKPDKTKIMLQLLERNSRILSALTEEGVIHKEAVKEAKLIKLEYLDGIDTNKECEAYLERNKGLLALHGYTRSRCCPPSITPWGCSRRSAYQKRVCQVMCMCDVRGRMRVRL